MADPVIPSAGNVDPGNPGQIVVFEGDEERVIDRNVIGLGEEVKKLRAERRALNARLTQTATERDTLAKEKADLAQRIADAEASKADAEAWREHQRRENDALKEANAAKLAALTPEQRTLFEGVTDEAMVARMLKLLPAAATPATYPSGGAAPIAAPVGDDLTPAEEAWVRSSRKDLIGVDNAVVKRFFKQFGPK